MSKLKWKKEKKKERYTSNVNIRIRYNFYIQQRYSDLDYELYIEYGENMVILDYSSDLKALKSKAERIYQIIKE